MSIIEAATEAGFEQTAVQDVLDLAGVSRRAFYDQFSSKQQCFLSTVDVLGAACAQRVAHACAETRGPVDRVDRALGAYFAALQSSPSAARALLTIAPRIGPDGRATLQRCSARFVAILTQNKSAFAGPLSPIAASAVVAGTRRVSALWADRVLIAEPESISQSLRAWASSCCQQDRTSSPTASSQGRLLGADRRSGRADWTSASES